MLLIWFVIKQGVDRDRERKTLCLLGIGSEWHTGYFWTPDQFTMKKMGRWLSLVVSPSLQKIWKGQLRQ